MSRCMHSSSRVMLHPTDRHARHVLASAPKSRSSQKRIVCTSSSRWSLSKGEALNAEDPRVLASLCNNDASYRSLSFVRIAAIASLDSVSAGNWRASTSEGSDSACFVNSESAQSVLQRGETYASYRRLFCANFALISDRASFTQIYKTVTGQPNCNMLSPICACARCGAYGHDEIECVRRSSILNTWSFNSERASPSIVLSQFDFETRVRLNMGDVNTAIQQAAILFRNNQCPPVAHRAPTQAALAIPLSSELPNRLLATKQYGVNANARLPPRVASELVHRRNTQTSNTLSRVRRMPYGVRCRPRSPLALRSTPPEHHDSPKGLSALCRVASAQSLSSLAGDEAV